MRQVIAAIASMIGALVLVHCGDEQAAYITHHDGPGEESGSTGEAGNSESKTSSDNGGGESAAGGTGGSKNVGSGETHGENGGEASSGNGEGGKGTGPAGRGGASMAKGGSTGRGGSTGTASSGKCAAAVTNQSTCTSAGDTCELTTDAGVGQTCTCSAAATTPIMMGRDAGTKNTWRCAKTAGGAGGSRTSTKGAGGS